MIEIPDSDHRKGIDITEDFKLQYGSDDKIDHSRLSRDEPHNIIDDVQIQQEVDRDSDIEVDMAYRVIDMFDGHERKTFKQEDENISPDTDTSFKTGFQNDYSQTKLKMEMENYLNGLENDVNNKPVCQLQSKGM